MSQDALTAVTGTKLKSTTGGGERFDAVVLAAGKGTRMRSDLHKLLHEAAGRPLLEHVLRALRAAGPVRTVVVIGHGGDAIRERFAAPDVEFVEQRELLGTGHALLQAGPALAGGRRPVMVLNGDGPLITTSTLEALASLQGSEAGMSLVTSTVSEPRGLGRIVRTAAGDVAGIVEEKDASPEQLAINEINPGIYAFDDKVFELASRLGNDNKSGEYYITDLLALYRQEGLQVRSLLAPSEVEVLAVNDKIELARADRALRDRIRRGWLVKGVTMTAPELVFIDDGVQIGRNVTLQPGVHLCGSTTLGDGVTVGQGAILTDCVVAAGAVIAPYTVATGTALG